MYEFHRPLKNLAACALLDDDDGRRILREIYRSYLEVAQRHGLPIQLGTPTWRASARWISDVERVNRDAVTFLRDVTRDASVPVTIVGVIGPSHDGYDATAALGTDDADTYHRRQVDVLASAGCDLLYAPTFPAYSELHGAARSMARTGAPFALAPMLNPDGTMPDGTSLSEVVERIDDDSAARPYHYMLGCLYPTHAQQVLEALFRSAPHQAHRVVGLKANASPLSPQVLEGANGNHGTGPEQFAHDLWACASRFGLNVLGGCCGTDAAYMEAVAALAPGAPTEEEP